MKVMDKLKNKIKFDKNLMLFLIILGFIAIIAGSFFVTILNVSDKTLINDHLKLYLDNIENGNINYLLFIKNNLLTNVIYILIIWLLGISIIGLPILVIVFFLKCFILGFSIGSIFNCFSIKGIYFSLVYIFPGEVINIISFAIITMYAMSFSIRLIQAVLKRKSIDFKLLINRYSLVLMIMLFFVIISNLYNCFVVPNIIKSILPFIR